MFTVAGYIDGVSYGVTVDDQDPTRAAGCADGSPAALKVLRDADGELLLLSPVGPELTVDITRPADVLAVLQARTEVTEVNGDGVPNPFGPSTPAVVH